MPFQNKVQSQQAPAVEGDFASVNPRATYDAGEGGLIAGPLGVTIGKFAWVQPDGITVTNYASSNAVPAGFIHRDQQGIIPNYLQEQSMFIPAGFPVTVMTAGDFWAKNIGANATTVGGSVYADLSNGDVRTTLSTGFSATGAIGSTNTAAIGATFTATGSTNVLTTSAVTGVISVGDTIAGTGVPAGTTILNQLTGTTGGAGTYTTSQNTTASAGTVTAFGKNLVVSSTTGLISIGDTVAGGTGFPTAATIVSQVSGTTGGAGTYLLSAPATAYVASATGVTTFGIVVNVTAVGSGTIGVGDAVSGTGFPSNAAFESQVSGAAGGIGVYTLNTPASAYAASTTITGVDSIVTTAWKFKTVNAVNEIAKISTWGN